jgi:AraC-like DNA-binding protein
MKFIELFKKFSVTKERLREAELQEQIREDEPDYPQCSIIIGKTETLNTLSSLLDNLMEEKKPYLDLHITLNKIALLLGSNRTYLSKILAEHGGYYAYLNEFRIKHLYHLLMERNKKKSRRKGEEHNLAEMPRRAYGRELQLMLVSSGFSDFRALKRALDVSGGEYAKKVKEILLS